MQRPWSAPWRWRRRRVVGALARQGALIRPLLLVALVAWVLGGVLFSGDIAMRAFLGHRLFAMAAPSGGVILIIGWLALAAAGLGALF